MKEYKGLVRQLIAIQNEPVSEDYYTTSAE
jgi:hypothetical protein